MCNPSQHLDAELAESSSYAPSTCSDEASVTEPFLKSRRDASSCSSTPSKHKHERGPPSVPSDAGGGLGAGLLDGLPPAQQMLLLSLLMFLFFGAHNILQEAIVRLLAAAEEGGGGSGGADTLMLSYAEVLGVAGLSYLERVHLTREGGLARVAPLRSYPLLTACLFASSCLSNWSLSYISFPTKVVFRSCKLVPTMIIATIVNQRVFRSYEYLCALSICAGLALFAMGDYTLESVKYSPLGLALVGGSVLADAIVPNAQERLFHAGSSRLEVTVYSNLFGLAGLTVVTLGNGVLVRCLRAMAADPTLATYFGAYTVLSYVSISCYMTLVKRFGGVSAVVLTTARKAMTLVLSYLLFPKGFSLLYVYASMLVLGAVMVAGICKKMERRTPPSEPADRRGGCRSGHGDATVGGKGDGDERGEARPTASIYLDGSQLERSAEAILEDISRRAYV